MSDKHVNPGKNQIVITVAGGHDPAPRELCFDLSDESMAVSDFAALVAGAASINMHSEVLRRLTPPESPSRGYVSASSGVTDGTPPMSDAFKSALDTIANEAADSQRQARDNLLRVSAKASELLLKELESNGPMIDVDRFLRVAIESADAAAKLRIDGLAAQPVTVSGDGRGACGRVVHVLLPDTVDEGAFQRFAELVRKEFSSELASS